jgi:hypothetical protein
MRPSESNREKAKVWTARIEQAEQFRGSTVEFCQKEGLSIHTFRHWKRKLQDLEHKAKPIESNPFARVSVLTQLQPREERRALPDPKWVAEVLLQLHRGMP